MFLEKTPKIFHDPFQRLQVLRLMDHLSGNEFRLLLHFIGKPLHIQTEFDFFPGPFYEVIDQIFYALNLTSLPGGSPAFSFPNTTFSLTIPADF